MFLATALEKSSAATLPKHRSCFLVAIWLERTQPSQWLWKVIELVAEVGAFRNYSFHFVTWQRHLWPQFCLCICLWAAFLPSNSYSTQVEPSFAFSTTLGNKIILVYCCNYLTKDPISLMTLRWWNLNNPIGQQGFTNTDELLLPASFGCNPILQMGKPRLAIGCRSHSEHPDETAKACAHAWCC